MCVDFITLYLLILVRSIVIICFMLNKIFVLYYFLFPFGVNSRMWKSIVHGIKQLENNHLFEKI